MPSVPTVRPAGFQLGNLGSVIEHSQKAYAPVSAGYGRDPWFPIIAHEPFPGAWQRNMELRGESVLGYPAVYACVTRISSDTSKVPVLLVVRDNNRIWTETESAAFSPVLREPNAYQTQSQFIEQWVFSKLIAGNTYVYTKRDNRQVVTEMHVLDPRTTKPLVADDGEIYYQAARDNLAGLFSDNNVLSATQVIHDRMNPMYHPLCGVTPLTAAGMPAIQGLAMQRQSTGFFQNAARPGGLLTAPGRIDPATAERIKQYFENEYVSGNAGKIAVMGDGLTYVPLTMNAVDAEIIKQLEMTATQVCACYQVPAFMVGFGETPKYDNIEAQIRLYFSQCLQSLMLTIEGLLDRALGLMAPKEGVRYGTMFDLDVLFDMDTSTLMKTMTEGVRGMVLSPDEARKRLNLPPKKGGDAVFGQHQQYPIDILADRERPLPGEAALAPAAVAPAEDESDEEDIEADAIRAAWMFERHMERLAA